MCEFSSRIRLIKISRIKESFAFAPGQKRKEVEMGRKKRHICVNVPFLLSTFCLHTCLDHTHWLILNKEDPYGFLCWKEGQSMWTGAIFTWSKYKRKPPGFLWYRITYLRVSKLWPAVLVDKVFMNIAMLVLSLVCLFYGCFGVGVTDTQGLRYLLSGPLEKVCQLGFTQQKSGRGKVPQKWSMDLITLGNIDSL